MKQERQLSLQKYISDDINVKQQIYSIFSGQCLRDRTVCAQKFIQFDEQWQINNQKVPKNQNQIQSISKKQQQTYRQQNKSEIQKLSQKKRIQQNNSEQFQNFIIKKNQQNQLNSSKNYNQFFSFNFDWLYSFSETPEYRQMLNSPLKKFLDIYQNKINQLYSFRSSKRVFKQLGRNCSPMTLVSQPGTYFVGKALYYKKQELQIQSLFFYHLAVFTSPFEQKIWQMYLDALKKMGKWRLCTIIAKTGFLFTTKLGLAEQYLLCGDKHGLPAYQMRGLLSSLSQPQKYQRLILQSAKIQIKKRKIWRGMHLLLYSCVFFNFNSSCGSFIVLMSKMLEKINLRQIGICILSKAITQKNQKLEVFDCYIEMVFRYCQGVINNQYINYFENNMKNITLQNKYRASLSLAQNLKGNKILQKKFYLQGLNSIKKYILQQNRQKPMRAMYFMILSSYCLKVDQILLKKYPDDDQLKFFNNKYRFIKGQPLIKYQFKDWKFYMHYALQRDIETLRRCHSDYNQGRVLAQYIHVVRMRKNPLRSLDVWREKIDQAPKSGQLWCQGARIYIQLDEISNAKKCLQAAIHFTPQFGDSFFQLLKIFMKQNSYYEINQLKKNFFISQPFYGNVFSFIRLHKYQANYMKLSLNQIWEVCEYYINVQLYNRNLNTFFKNFTAFQPYNEAFLKQNDEKTREKLFLSYEIMQNKYSK